MSLDVPNHPTDILVSVLAPHSRRIRDEFYMFEPLLTGQVYVPNDHYTKDLILNGYLEEVKTVLFTQKGSDPSGSCTGCHPDVCCPKNPLHPGNKSKESQC